MLAPATKFFVPDLPDGWVRRERVVSLLNPVLRLTVIAAPAGFGKTSLAIDWIRGVGLPIAWVSLDERENELRQFVICLMRAVRPMLPNAAEVIEDFLQSEVDLKPVDCATLLINTLLDAPSSFALVLDDYHLLTSAIIQEFLAAVIDHAPPSLHIVLITRVSPPLPLARWRVQGWLREVRATDLRFSADEQRALLRDVPLSENEWRLLDARTEGWAAGLKLAGLSLRSAPNAATFLQAFDGHHHHVFDYLVAEVLAHLPDDLRTFLIQTAPLERLCAPLCDAVCKRDDSQQMIARVEAANYFLIALDEWREWYRYHALFADALSIYADTATIYARAAEWCAANGVFEDALHYAIKTNDMGVLVQAATPALVWTLRSGDFPALRRWLALLPDALVRSNPLFALCRAWLAVHARRISEAAEYVYLAQTFISPDVPRELREWVAAVRGLVAYYRYDYGAALAAIDSVQTDAPSHLEGLYGWVRGLAYWGLGNSKRAIEVMREAVRQTEIRQDPFALCGISYYLALYLAETGRSSEAQIICEMTIAQVTDDAGNPRLVSTMLHVLLGEIYMRQMRLDEAEQSLLTGVRLGHSVHLTESMLVGSLNLAQLYHLRGQPERCKEILAEAERVTTQTGMSEHRSLLDTTRAWLRLWRGDVNAVLNWMESVQVETGAQRFVPNTTLYVRGLILQRNFAEAVELIDTLEQIATERSRYLDRIAISLLRVTLYDAQGDVQRAQQALRGALLLAEQENIQSYFVREGEHLLALIPPLADAVPEFVALLTRRRAIHLAHEEALIEALSARELEVLKLMADGYSNRDIAAELVVAPSTIKTHTLNIFGKLGVNSRTQATARARRLRLIE